MTFNKHISESAIIDYLIGNLKQEENSEVIRHVNQCQACQETMKSWDGLLGDQEQNKAVPSEALKAKLDNSIDKEETKQLKKGRIKPLYLFSSIATALFLFVGLLSSTSSQPPMMEEEVVYNDNIQVEQIQSNPGTIQHEIRPESRFDYVSGNVWINNRTRELLIEIDGLMNLNGHNYQLWMIDKNNRMEGKLLPLEDGSVKVLYRGKDVNEIKFIKSSIEPAGGSSEPTGPETFTVHLD
ncbi:hypothetical protein [Virgibacillus sp. JSM 102003]|uniref:hypothetical protein n=1 Tax=Virgibacillus sp. JSM 102003 TaxID=1562108 RepID=UPI0035C16E55